MEINTKLSWDEYFMSLAIVSSMRSKDTRTKVGACIVNNKNRVVSLGYNGMPNGCIDTEMPWEFGETNLNTKYYYVVHAEINAIINSNNYNLDGCILYTTLFPCCECCKAIIQSGISEVIYYSDKYADSESTIASKFMFEKANVKIRKYTANGKSLNIIV
ncbi:MAG: deoxycytidylate deaminase [Eubacterium sp.]